MKKSVRMLLVAAAAASFVSPVAAEDFYFRPSPHVVQAPGTGNGGELPPGASTATIADTEDTFVPDASRPEDFGPGKEFDIVGNTVLTKSKRLLVTPYGSVRDTRYLATTRSPSPPVVTTNDDFSVAITAAQNSFYLPILFTFPNAQVVGTRLTLLPTSSVPNADGLYEYDLSYVVYPDYAAASVVRTDPPCANGEPLETSYFARTQTLAMTIGLTTSDQRPEKMHVIPTQVNSEIVNSRLCRSD